jgi:hypothetical protein
MPMKKLIQVKILHGWNKHQVKVDKDRAPARHLSTSQTTNNYKGKMYLSK